MTEADAPTLLGALKRFARLALPLGVIAVLPACGAPFTRQAPSYRYKETVVVETPQGIRRGSTVIEAQMSYVAFDGYVNLLPSRFKGQAVAIDLPNGKVLFGLPAFPENWEWAKTAYQYLIPQQPFYGDMSLGKSPEDRQYQLAMALKGPQILPRYRGVVGHPGYTESAYPEFIRFNNIDDPSTVEKVDPDHLDAAFRPGYNIKAIILERTNEKIRYDLNYKLPWLNKLTDYRSDKSNPFTSKIPHILDGIESH